MKTVALNEAGSRLDKLFDMGTLEKMLQQAVEGPHAEWTPQDLEDIARRVREKRKE